MSSSGGGGWILDGEIGKNEKRQERECQDPHVFFPMQSIDKFWAKKQHV